MTPASDAVPAPELFRTQSVGKDLIAGTVVFLVALPLCLGIAHASGAPVIAGIISGILGGIVVGLLSGSHISVSGPAAEVRKWHGVYAITHQMNKARIGRQHLSDKEPLPSSLNLIGEG